MSYRTFVADSSMPITSSALNVIYQDDCLVAIIKPAGLLVHRSKLDIHDTNNALNQLREQTGRFLYPVHRLDKPTSGILLFALDTCSARIICQQFEKNLIDKYYLAVVRGYTEKQGVVDYAISDRDAKPPRRNPAVTAYKRLATIELPHRIDRYPTTRYSLLDVQPFSGRRHQIRLHLKHINHPLIGDSSYGKALHNKLFRQEYATSRLLLHARKLVVAHPQDGRELVLSANIQECSTVDNGQFETVLSDKRWNQTTQKGLQANT